MHCWCFSSIQLHHFMLLQDRLCLCASTSICTDQPVPRNLTVPTSILPPLTTSRRTHTHTHTSLGEQRVLFVCDCLSFCLVLACICGLLEKGLLKMKTVMFPFSTQELITCSAEVPFIIRPCRLDRDLAPIPSTAVKDFLTPPVCRQR